VVGYGLGFGRCVALPASEAMAASTLLADFLVGTLTRLRTLPPERQCEREYEYMNMNI
jgi:hypothetical protein